MVILLTSVISPVTATVETLRVLLLYITGFLLILSVLLALYLSKKIARPIIKMSDAAKELAKGNYSASFDAGGYREIAELAIP